MLELRPQHGVQLIAFETMSAGHHTNPTVAGILKIRSGSDLEMFLVGERMERARTGWIRTERVNSNPLLAGENPAVTG